VEETGRSVRELLPQLFRTLIDSLNFPKNMRWGNIDMRFVRPIRWMVALFGSEVIPFTVAEVTAGNVTRGHRFMSKGDIAVTSVDDYFSKLAENHVMVDQDVRRAVIREQIEKMAVSQGGTASIDEDLLEEVVFLVEYPTSLCGRFEDKYLSLPPEAVITPMREHQRYFPVFGKDGKLLPVFITIRNGGADYIDIVRHGNERVLRARLDDARFFFEEDQKIKLADRVEKLKTIVFQDGLGTLYDKTKRLEELSAFIIIHAGRAESELVTAKRAAYLAKADLVTGMVNEFTELQGVMGREYASLSGEDSAVATAIYEHYLPRFAGDSLPASVSGQAVSIADKLDNIVATFSRGLIPTGSQDPFALRRQALGIVNILLQGQYHVSLDALFAYTMDLLNITSAEKRAKITADLQDFFRLRLKNILVDEKIRYDMIDAVMAVGTDDVYDTWLRAKAISLNGGTAAMQQAVQALTRVANLAKNAASEVVDSALLSHEAEVALYEAYEQANKSVSQLIEKRDYPGVLQVMAQLAQPIDAFFGAVMVMVEDQGVRNNRLALLKSITTLAQRVADLSKIAVN
jgi:glycyl-tRNA synthetase beta chain